MLTDSVHQQPGSHHREIWQDKLADYEAFADFVQEGGMESGQKSVVCIPLRNQSEKGVPAEALQAQHLLTSSLSRNSLTSGSWRSDG